MNYLNTITPYTLYKEISESEFFVDKTLMLEGYQTPKGEKIFNPRSVICALTANQIQNYWTSSGPYDEIFYYIKNNIADVREDMVRMVAGEAVPVRIQNYAAVSMEVVPSPDNGIGTDVE